MENRNIFTAGIINGQYKKGTYYTPEGKTLTGIHVFTTLGRSSQRIVPMISPTARVDLANMNPNDEVAKPVRVIAKINGNVFSGGPIGINYEGEKGCLYISASVYNDHQAPAISYTYAVPKYSPAFCVKSDGTATIRWFSSQNKMQNAINACDCIIAGAHAIVFDGKCTTDENVYDNETGTDNHKLIYNTNGDQSATRWDTSVVSSATADETAKRCCFGHKAGSDGVYIMVCTDSYASLHEMANLMKLLGCDYAVNLDGNGSVQMRIKDGYGASGKVTSASGNLIYAGIAAYLA